MIIIGAGNLGKLILDQLIMESNPILNTGLVFYDENTDSEKVFDTYKILKNKEELLHYKQETGDNMYFVAIGNSRLRKRFDDFFKSHAFAPQGVITPNYVRISSHSTVGGHLYMGYVCGVYHSTVIGYGNIIHSATKIAHGVTIGDFVNICSNVNVCADVSIGDFTFIGTNALILPNVKIGKNCYVSAGSIIKSNMKDFETR